MLPLMIFCNTITVAFFVFATSAPPLSRRHDDINATRTYFYSELRRMFGIRADRDCSWWIGNCFGFINIAFKTRHVSLLRLRSACWLVRRFRAVCVRLERPSATTVRCIWHCIRYISQPSPIAVVNKRRHRGTSAFPALESRTIGRWHWA